MTIYDLIGKYKGSLRHLKRNVVKRSVNESTFSKIDSLAVEPFQRKVYWFINNINEPPKCQCGELLKFNTSKNEYAKFCSVKCRSASTEWLDKRRQTNLKKYGTQNVCNTKENIAKRLAVVEQKYGTKLGYIGTDEYKTSLTTYVKNNRRIKQSQTLKTRHFHNVICTDEFPFKPLFDFDNYKGAASYNIEYLWQCKECGSEFKHWLNNGIKFDCPSCTGKGTKPERILADFLLRELNVTVQLRQRKLLDNKYELDLYLPDYKIGIEVDGLFWHSERCKTASYHKTKRKFIESKGIRLISFYDDEIINATEKVFAKLRSILGKNENRIHARKCKVVTLQTKEKKQFNEKYHLQGDVNTSVNYGLKHNNELVMVMTFAKRTIFNKSGWELVRMCSKNNTTVIGGASKLLTHFLRNYPTQSIVTYAHNRLSTGNVYKQLNFTKQNQTDTSFWFTCDFKSRQSRHKFQKHKLYNLLEKYDPTLSALENLHNHNVFRVWDHGTSCFTLKQTK